MTSSNPPATLEHEFVPSCFRETSEEEPPLYNDVPQTSSPQGNVGTFPARGEETDPFHFPDSKLEDDQVSHDSQGVAEVPIQKNSVESYPRVLQPLVKLSRTLVPYGSLASNVFSLASVTLGGAIISMPSSFATSGIAMSIIYLVVITWMTVYSMMMMGLAMRMTGARNFEESGEMLFGRGWGYFVGGVMWLSCVGTAIAYISAAVSLVTPLLVQSSLTSPFFKTTNGINVVVIILWLFLLVPITIPKRVNTVRYVSVIGVSMVLYFVACIVVHGSITLSNEGLREDVLWFTTGNTAIYGLSIFVFAYMCQGVAYSVYYEMQPRQSVGQLTIASAIGMTACMIFYILAGFFGYISFGEDTQSSVLYNFDPIHQPYIMIAYLGMMVKICAAYGMNMIPVRNFQYHCLGWDLDTTPYSKHCVMIIITSAVVLAGGLYIPNINLAFGLVGSLCGGFIGFLFPAFFWMYCGKWSLKTVGVWHYIGTWILIFSGVVAITFGTVSTIYFSFWP